MFVPHPVPLAPPVTHELSADRHSDLTLELLPCCLALTSVRLYLPLSPHFRCERVVFGPPSQCSIQRRGRLSDRLRPIQTDGEGDGRKRSEAIDQGGRITGNTLSADDVDILEERTPAEFGNQSDPCRWQSIRANYGS